MAVYVVFEADLLNLALIITDCVQPVRGLWLGGLGCSNLGEKASSTAGEFNCSDGMHLTNPTGCYRVHPMKQQGKVDKYAAAKSSRSNISAERVGGSASPVYKGSLENKEDGEQGPQPA